MPDWETGAYASSIAENYARYLVPAVFNTWAAETINHAQPRPGDAVLDVACGTGVVTFEVARMVGAAGQVAGVDLDPAMLAIAERIRRARGELNVRFREMSAQDLKFADDTFDRVICQHGLMFFGDKVKSVKEMYRVLSPGGKLVITTWSTRLSTPHESLFADAFHAHLDEEPPFFKTLFIVGDRGDMEEILRDAGVKPHALVERVQRMAVFPTSDAYWNGMAYGRPIRVLAASLPQAVQDAIKEDALAKIEPFKARTGYISPMEAVIATVVKP